MLHLGSIVRFDKGIQIILQVVQRHLEFSPKGRQKKLLQQDPVELLAKKVIGMAGLVHWQVLDVGGGEEGFKWMHGKQSAIFARSSGVNFFDCNPTALEKGHNTALENIQGVHRIFRGVDLCKCDAGIAVHDGFNVNTARPGKIANIFDRAEEKRFLEE